MARTPTALLSPADQDRRRGLQLMKGIALGALLLSAAVFAFAFAFEEQIPWLVYVRAPPKARWSVHWRTGSP